MDYKKSAEEVALSYLARRMRTEFEVRSHLAQKDFCAEEIDPVIRDLKARRYIDDHEYAMQFIEYGYSRNHAGARILKELAEKGVDSETARFAYEDYLYENKLDEYELAREHAMKMLENALSDNKAIDAEKLKARIGRNLSGRGFRSGEIYRVLSEIDDRLRG